VGLVGGAGARDPGMTTINARKHQRRAPWEVPELEIQKRPPSMLENTDGAPSMRDGGISDSGGAARGAIHSGEGAGQ
jgi:hypothetical protein